MTICFRAEYAVAPSVLYWWLYCTAVCILILRVTRYCDPGIQGHTPFHLAAFENCAKTLKVLLRYGADATAKDIQVCLCGDL